MNTRDDPSLSLQKHRQILIDIIEQTDRLGTVFTQYTWPWSDDESRAFSKRYDSELHETRKEINLTLAHLGGLACNIDLNDGRGEMPYTLITWLGGHAGKMEWLVAELPKAQITIDRSVINELRANHGLE